MGVSSNSHYRLPKESKRSFFYRVTTYLNFCYLLSFVSICVNTPTNYCIWGKYTIYSIFLVDIIVTLVFIVDFSSKSKDTTISKISRYFDVFLIIVHILSLITHIFEIAYFECTSTDRYIFELRWCRVFRPLISFKLFECIFNIQVTSKQFQMIYGKVKNQLYNVTIFFLFISTFFSILGIQIFSQPEHRCVRSENITMLTSRDLAVPDTLCSNDETYGNQCPPNMFCREMKDVQTIQIEFQYNNLINSFFTVYKAASQEEWTNLMYEKLDQMPAFEPILFYISLIFFLSWLVKNLFIAVVTQSFELIRAHHLQSFWSHASSQVDVVNEVVNHSFRIDRDWNLIEQHESDHKDHFLLKKLYRIFQSTAYNYVVLAQIIVEAGVISSIDFKEPDQKVDYHFYTEIGLTFFFVADVLLKMITYGYKSYLRESIHKFELVLMIGCLINLIPSVNRLDYFILFKVLRIIRLIKVSPLLESFIYRIFGPSKKLGVIILFTAITLIIISAISLQLFCTIELYSDFSTFTLFIFTGNLHYVNSCNIHDQCCT